MPAEFIRASAGSGKTYQLSGRYLGILLRGLRRGEAVDPGQILATTFTRAAAGEILERVLSRLARAVLSAEERTQLEGSARSPQITAGECQTVLSHLAQNLHRVQIGTIDSFFAKIARSMPEELGLSAGWRVVSEVEAEQLSQEVIDKLLTDSASEETIQLWRIYLGYRSQIQISQPLKRAMEASRFQPLATPHREFSGEPPRLTTETVKALSRLIESSPSLLTKKGEPAKPYQKSRQSFIDSLRPGVRLDLLLRKANKSSLLVRLLRNEQSSAAGTAFFPEELRENLQDFLRQLELTMTSLARDREAALYHLTSRYRQQYDLLAQNHGWLTFRDVEQAVCTGIKEDDGSAMADLYFRLDSHLQHLLFDEFQDTSWSQMQFFDPLVREFLSKGQEVIVVGDPKQAIYGWRGGDRAVIDSFAERFDLRPEDQTHLNTSFRSSPIVLQAVDEVFLGLPKLNPERLGGPEVTQGIADWLRGYQKHQAASSVVNLPGRVRLLETSAEAEEPGDALIEKIIEAVHGHYQEGREVAVLTRRKALIPRLLAELRLRNLPASGDGGSNITDSFAVETMLAALTWLDHPEHSLARELASQAHWTLGAEKSPTTVDSNQLHSRHSLDQETRHRWQRRWSDSGAAALIGEWLATWPEALPAHDQQRVEQLRDLANRYDLAGGGRISAFIEFARRELVRAVQHSPIRVMTIHASKGLEFTSVILTDLYQPSRSSIMGEPRFVSHLTEEGLVSQLVPESILMGGQALREQAAQQTFMEMLSVLYVGMTRAQSYLDLIILGQKNPDDGEKKVTLSMASILRGTLGSGYNYNSGSAMTDSSSASRPKMRSQDPVFALESPRLALRPSALTRVEMRSPSAEEGSGLRPVSQLFNTRQDLALTRGTLIHEWLAQIEWLPEAISQAMAERSGAEPLSKVWSEERFQESRSLWEAWGEKPARIEFEKLKQRFTEPAILEIFQRVSYEKRWSAGQLELWRERRFVSVVQGQPWSGAFDRVVLLRNSLGQVTRAEILDFKSDQLPTPEARIQREAFYAPQLTAYRLILEERFPQAIVTTRLVFI